MESAKKAREAAFELSAASSEHKNEALRLFKEELKAQRSFFEAANARDVADAEIAVKENRLSPTLLKRLVCKGEKFDSVIRGIDDVIDLPDPVGICTLAKEVAKDLNLYRVTCPIGVLLIIFESRPDAAVQIAALAIKSGNSAILKGGKEAVHSNHAIETILQSSLSKASGVPKNSIQVVDTRDDVVSLLGLDKYIDLVIPRGSNELVRYIKDHTRIPVLGHADGLCSIYVDKTADVVKMENVVFDAKTDYPAACNACETLLLHSAVVEKFLPVLAKRFEEKKVVFHADDRAFPYLPKDQTYHSKPEDFEKEFLTLELAVKVVDSVEEAVVHINEHGSHHTDVIIAEDSTVIEKFLSTVDSAGVYANCSSRFADGFRYGFGAEVGISTNRIHARGPVGLEGLVTYRYRLYGNGHYVGQFQEGGLCQYVHKNLPIEGRLETISAISKFEAENRK